VNENEFNLPDDVPEELRKQLANVGRDMQRAHVLGHAVEEFTDSIRQCMVQEGVNLEAAIAMGREVVERDAEMEAEADVMSELPDLLREAFGTAARKMRTQLVDATLLVTLNANGSPTPRAYDQRQHLEFRAREQDKRKFAETVLKTVFRNGEGD
jgi:hypothetical protein